MDKMTTYANRGGFTADSVKAWVQNRINQCQEKMNGESSLSPDEVRYLSQRIENLKNTISLIEQHQAGK